MFRTRHGNYAPGMERNASAANLLTLSQPSAARPSIARICGAFALRCLKAVAEGYIQSCAYYPFWIGADPYWLGASPLPKLRQNEARN
jgi:hypothetical protein